MERENAKVDIEDRGYQFGDGIYEVVRVYNGKFFTLDEHLARFVRSATELHIKLPFTVEALTNLLEQLVEKNELINGYVYIQLTRGAADRIHNYADNLEPVLTMYSTVRERALSDIENGVDVYLHEDIRWLRCDIKSLNLLPNTLANTVAKNKGGHEAILHRGKIVTEASASNIFIVKNNELVTHPANNLILNGITRGKILQIAEDLKIPVKEEAFTIEELFAADEAFITNTGVEIGPINHVDDKAIGTGKPGPVTRKLQKAFEALLPS